MNREDIIFREVKDDDFEQIVVLYHEYLDWQRTQEGRQEKYLTADEMRDVFHKRKKGSQAENYNLSKAPLLSNHYGWVAEEKGRIIAYYEWGGNLDIDNTCKAYISVYENRKELESIAEELLVYTFGELKKIGFKIALGHISPRMARHPQFQFLEKYADRKIEEIKGKPELGIQFQKDL